MSNSPVATASSSGIGFTGLLTILFIALKLTSFIHWSWWWVLSPLWITPLVMIACVICFFAVMLIAAVIVALFDR